MGTVDKAKELVQKYLYKVIELAYAETESKELAKQCALICVEEILTNKTGMLTDWTNRIEYWEEVKLEINRL